MARSKRVVPGLQRWNTYAGGTGAARGKTSYTIYLHQFGVPTDDSLAGFSISPYTYGRGHHAGYVLTVWNVDPKSHGHQWVDVDGTGANFPIPGSSYRDPRAAVAASEKYMQRVMADKHSARQNSRPAKRRG